MSRPRAAIGVAAGLLLSACAGGGGCPPRPCAPAPAVGPLRWTTLRDPAHLRQELAAARRAGRPVVVQVWAPWCKYCRDDAELMNGNARIRTGLERLVRLNIDVDTDPRADLRDALGIPRDVQPYLAWIDARGVVRPDLAVPPGPRSESERELVARLAALGALDGCAGR